MLTFWRPIDVTKKIPSVKIENFYSQEKKSERNVKNDDQRQFKNAMEM